MRQATILHHTGPASCNFLLSALTSPRPSLMPPYWLTTANSVIASSPTPPPPEISELQALVRRLEALLEMRQQERNRLAAGIA